MKPLLCPSPQVLDQQFPRTDAELEEISISLGEIHQGLQDGTYGLILPEMFSLFIETFDWNRTASTPILRDIYRILESWLLRLSSAVLRPVLDAPVQELHPLPCGTPSSDEARLWAEELYKLLQEHDRHCPSRGFFVGVASSSAFCGGLLEGYCPEPSSRCFPLVGPADMNRLEGYFEWRIPSDLHQQKVTFSQALKNVPLLGGVVERPHASSHYRVTFKGGSRPWSLDCNDDPQEDYRIAQVAPLCGRSFDFVKFVLIYGEIPRLVGKFDGCLGLPPTS